MLGGGELLITAPVNTTTTNTETQTSSSSQSHFYKIELTESSSRRNVVIEQTIFEVQDELLRPMYRDFQSTSESSSSLTSALVDTALMTSEYTNINGNHGNTRIERKNEVRNTRAMSSLAESHVVQPLYGIVEAISTSGSMTSVSNIDDSSYHYDLEASETSYYEGVPITLRTVESIVLNTEDTLALAQASLSTEGTASGSKFGHHHYRQTLATAGNTQTIYSFDVDLPEDSPGSYNKTFGEAETYDPAQQSQHFTETVPVPGLRDPRGVVPVDDPTDESGLKPGESAEGTGPQSMIAAMAYNLGQATAAIESMFTALTRFFTGTGNGSAASTSASTNLETGNPEDVDDGEEEAKQPWDPRVVLSMLRLVHPSLYQFFQSRIPSFRPYSAEELQTRFGGMFGAADHYAESEASQFGLYFRDDWTDKEVLTRILELSATGVFSDHLQMVRESTWKSVYSNEDFQYYEPLEKFQRERKEAFGQAAVMIEELLFDVIRTLPGGEIAYGAYMYVDGRLYEYVEGRLVEVQDTAVLGLDVLKDPRVLTGGTVVAVIIGTNGIKQYRKLNAPVKTVGQIHHVISTKVGRAIDNHPILKGVFARRDNRFVTQAIDGAAHRGYQRWHRELDAEVVKWIEDNPTKNADDFLSFLTNLYQRADIKARFPNGF